MNDIPRSFDITAAFRNKQVALEARFLAIRNVTDHPTTLGDHSEVDWTGLVRDFLPERYSVGPIFAVDHLGQMSQQIDLGIYDTHFSPQWFGAANGARFVPVESVYAALEVKPNLNRETIKYAKEKVASVRGLTRTSAPIRHAGGWHPPVRPEDRPIIGGLLATKSYWKRRSNGLKAVADLMSDQTEDGFLNVGIALESFTFDFTPDARLNELWPDGQEPTTTMKKSAEGDQLIHFAIRLFTQLQMIGTCLATDMSIYEASMTSQ